MINEQGISVTRRPSMTREVYVVQAVQLGLIKIGVADDALKRLLPMGPAMPDRLRLLNLFLCHGYGRLEGELHRRFEHLRSHGEWFHPGPELLAFIASEKPSAKNRFDKVAAALDAPFSTPRGRRVKRSAEPSKNVSCKTDAKPVALAHHVEGPQTLVE